MARNPTAALIVTLASAALAGCSNFQPLSSGTEDPCATLHNIVTDYPTGFADYRGSSSNFNSVTIYRAKEQLIKGHCEIWAWGNGDSAYTCTVSAPDKAVAETLHARAANELSECLGPEWQSEQGVRERDGQPAGEVTRFTSGQASAPAVSLHRVEDHRRHSVYLYIGTGARSPQQTD
ncbi:hypothetical protein ABIE59_002621 [Marinobacter sp. MBR-99]|jgi:hypothetical protein|uniref:hypothetical protein n=1 Tax=Marinobacter sp. MBR-99 TaxID=3156461 RepID=UPI003398C44F